MSLRLYLIGIGVTAACALTIWLWILWTVDPFSATQFEFVLFFLCLFIWLTGLATLASFYIRLLKSKNEFYYGNLIVSLRQSFFLALFVTASLILRGLGLVDFYEIILLFFAFVLFELYFFARK